MIGYLSVFVAVTAAAYTTKGDLEILNHYEHSKKRCSHGHAGVIVTLLRGIRGEGDAAAARFFAEDVARPRRCPYASHLQMPTPPRACKRQTLR